jgi:hypothetical protein
MARKDEPNEKPDARKISALTAEGRRVSLADLPVVAYRLSCGHVGKDYAIQKQDLLFCADCGATSRVSAILSD